MLFEPLKTIITNDTITALACSPDNKTVVVGLENGTVDLFNACTGDLLLTLKASDQSITSLA